MFLLELFAMIRARRRSTQRHNEDGTEITRRLRELLDSTIPKQLETPSTIAAGGSLPQSRRPLRREEG
jgi:hypothetical protein